MPKRLPKRIQRKRGSYWTMPEGAIYVGRPTIFGNPFESVSARKFERGANYTQEQHSAAVRCFRGWVCDQVIGDHGFRHQVLLLALPALRGRDLVCWCPLNQPCHADVLLELANAD